MAYEVEITDEWGAWFEALSAEEQEEVAATIGLLEEHGPHLPFPYSSGVASSRHPRMRELRTQVHGRPYRMLYAFDPRRASRETRPEMIGGTTCSCLGPTTCTTSTSGSSRRRV